MSSTHVEIKKVIFDLSNSEVTKVTVEIDHDDTDGLLKRRYEKTFPASIPIVDLLQKHMFGSEENYLFW